DVKISNCNTTSLFEAMFSPAFFSLHSPSLPLSLSLSTFTFCSVPKHCGLTKSKQITLLPNAHDPLPRLFRHQQLLSPHHILHV
ncbi:unnamed protein product, partial [Musa textilis]